MANHFSIHSINTDKDIQIFVKKAKIDHHEITFTLKALQHVTCDCYECRYNCATYLFLSFSGCSTVGNFLEALFIKGSILLLECMAFNFILCLCHSFFFFSSHHKELSFSFSAQDNLIICFFFFSSHTYLLIILIHRVCKPFP